MILGRNHAQSQRPHIISPWECLLFQNFAPGIDRIAGENGRDMPSAVDGGNPEGVGQPVEAQCAGQADDVAAVDYPLTEAPILFGMLVKVHLGGILIEPRGDHVVALLHGHGVNMVDLFTGFIIIPEVGTARQPCIVAGEVEPLRHDQISARNGFRQLRHDRLPHFGVRIALAHHHPAHVVQHHFTALVGADRAHIDSAGLAVGVLLESNHLRDGAECVTGIDRQAEPALGIAEIGNGIERDIRNGFTEHHMEHQHVVHGCFRQPDSLGESTGGVRCKTGAVQSCVQGAIPLSDSPWGGMDNLLTQLKVFKKITRVGFVCHIALSVCFKMVPDYFPDVRKACASSLRSKTWGAILRCENA